MRNQAYLLEDIQNMLLTILYTSCVAEAVPVSGILVADSGTAKSKLIKQFQGKQIHHTDSFSSKGLFDLMTNDRDNKLKWILTADINPTLSRRQATVTATVANLLSLTMDGTCRTDDGRADKISKHDPIGFLTAVTPDMFSKQTKKWFSLGLSRRIIPLYYTYSQSTIEKLKRIVREDKINGANFPFCDLDLSKSHNPVINDIMALHIESLATIFSQNLGLQKMKDNEGHIKWYMKNIVHISPIVTLRTLAKSNAIRAGRGSVEQPDIDFLAGFVEYTNQSMPKQI